MEHITIPNLFSTITTLEEAFFIESLLGQGWVVRNVSDSFINTPLTDIVISYRVNIAGDLSRISPSTSFTSTPFTGGPIEH